MKVPVQDGFTLIEAILGIAIIAVAIGSIAAIFPLYLRVSERETTEVEISIVAQSIKDAIITGAQENYDPNNNAFSFVYEGVAVMVKLPQRGTQASFPWDRDDELRKQVPQPPDSIMLGLYPIGLLYRGEVMKVYRVSKSDSGAFPLEIRTLINESGSPILDTFIGPSFDEDREPDGILDAAEDINRNGYLDTIEDVGIDGLRDELEPGYHPISSPDPAHDNFDPIMNPFGTERNGRFDVSEPFNDLNNNGIRDSQEAFTDVNLNGRFDGETDLNNNGYLEVPDRRKMPSDAVTYLQDSSYRLSNYGYAIRVYLETDGTGVTPFIFEVFVYKDFFKVRPALQSAGQDILDAAALPEIQTENLTDDDGDGVTDDKIVTDSNNTITGVPAAIPEVVLNGIDDDNDGVVDDGLVKPDFVVKFSISF